MYLKIFKLISFFPQKFKLLFLLIILLSILTMVLEVVSISLVVPLTSSLLENFNSPNQGYIYRIVYFFFENSFFEDLFFFCLVLFGVLFFIKVLSNLLLQVITIYFSFKIYEFLISKVLKSYLQHQWSFFIKKNTAEIIRDILSETGVFRSSIILPLANLVSELIILIGIIVLLFFFDFKFTIILMLTFFVVSILYRFFFKAKLNKLSQNRQNYSTKLNKNIIEIFKLIKEVKLSFRENYFYNIFTKNVSNFIKSNFSYNFISLLPRYFFEILILLVFSIILFLKNIDQNNMNEIIPSMSLYLLASLRLMPSIVKILRSFQNIDWGGNSVDVLYDLFRSANIENINNNSKFIKKLPFKNKILFQNVSFTYGEENVIKNFNQEFLKNEIIGIVGKSGSGKTTITNILMGFLSPSSGRILVDNQDIQKNLNGWQKNIFLVQQDNIILDDTIRNNITFSMEDGEIDDKKYEIAVKDAHLTDYISQLPDKDETITGESGIKISGGQKQRLSIARALYYDPEILILDEFTSALDSVTEKEILETLKKLKNKKTIFIITHRSEALKICDKIINL